MVKRKRVKYECYYRCHRSGQIRRLPRSLGTWFLKLPQPLIKDVLIHNKALLKNWEVARRFRCFLQELVGCQRYLRLHRCGQKDAGILCRQYSQSEHPQGLCAGGFRVYRLVRWAWAARSGGHRAGACGGLHRTASAPALGAIHGAAPGGATRAALPGFAQGLFLEFSGMKISCHQWRSLAALPQS